MDSGPIELSKLEKMLTKSIWRPRGGPIWTFVCPLCRVTRRLPFRNKLGGGFQVFQLVLTTLAFLIAAWPWFGWRGLVSFVPFCIVFEAIYRWRRRAALACRECGFDPFLYKIDLQGAKREIEEHWKRKFAEKGIAYPLKKGEKPPLPPVGGDALPDESRNSRPAVLPPNTKETPLDR